MTQPILLIFIDSYPYEYLDQMPFLSNYKRWQVKCGVGYSVNVKAELFAGMQPDDLGYFNEWTFDKNRARFGKHHWWLRLLTPLQRIYYADRLVHHGLRKFVFRTNINNVPYAYLQYFFKKGAPPYYDAFQFPSIFSEPNLKIVRYSDYHHNEDRDQCVYDQAQKEIDQLQDGENLFLAWADLDSFTHVHGVGSEPHMENIRKHDAMVKDCVQKFQAKFPDGHFVLVSDHSMANTTKGITFAPEEVWGKVSPDRYAYFLDANMLRVWTFDDVLREEIKSYLTEWDEGHLLTAEEREQYGLTNPVFGDFIFLLNEGTIFYKNFWGTGMITAMHGYHPDTEKQKGFVLSDIDFFTEDAGIPPSQAVYHRLKELMCPS